MSETVVVPDDPTVVVTPEQMITVVLTDPQIIVTPEQRTDVVLVPADTIVVNAGVGPQGPRGLTGPPGADGAPDSYYVHTQSAPAATWPITHNLGRPVHVTLLDSGGNHILTTSEQHPPYDVTTLTFPTPAVGTAYLS